MTEVVVRHRAVQQAEAIARHIAAHNSSAAERFMVEFANAIRQLREFPRSGSPEGGGELSRVVMTRFPYVIVYKVTRRRLSVLGVFHTARDPSIRSRR